METVEFQVIGFKWKTGSMINQARYCVISVCDILCDILAPNLSYYAHASKKLSKAGLKINEADFLDGLFAILDGSQLLIIHS